MMRLRKKLSAVCALFMLISIFLLGCGSTEDSTYKIYYLSVDKSEMIPIGYEYSSFETEDMLAESLQVLSKDVDSVDYMKTIPTEVSVLDYNLSDDGVLSIYFSKDYDALSTLTEIMVRAAVVRTLVQIDGVKAVVFYVSNDPLTDGAGAAVGEMTAETFIDDFGQETDSLLSTTLELYFASADGASVVVENRDIYYSSNITKERLIINQLLKGPENNELLKSIPSEAKVIGVSVTDGVCFVNFDSGFEASLTGVTENATVYSIVNSLTTQDNITAVQILVNGKTPSLANKDYDLSGQLTFNSEIVSELNDEDDEVVQWTDIMIGPDIPGGTSD